MIVPNICKKKIQMFQTTNQPFVIPSKIPSEFHEILSTLYKVVPPVDC